MEEETVIFYTTEAAEHVAQELFDAIITPEECIELKCPHYQGAKDTHSYTGGFDCNVFDNDLPNHLCRIVKRQMTELNCSFALWMEDFIDDPVDKESELLEISRNS